MSVRMKVTKAKTGARRAHQRARTLALAHDKDSGVTSPRHFMNPETGEYRGRKIVDVADQMKKKAAKAEATPTETEEQSSGPHAANMATAEATQDAEKGEEKKS